MSDRTGVRDLRSFVVGREPSVDRRFRPRPDINQRRNLFDNDIDEEESFEDTESQISADNDENEDPLVETFGSSTGAEEEQDSLEQGALIYLRFRPTKEESVFSTRENVLIVDPSLSEKMKTSNNKNTIEKQYVFSDIFHREIPQADVYENCVRIKIDTEDSFTLLTYGTSGSGKTYTLLGTEVQPGIIPRSLEHIFSFYSKKIYPNASAKLISGRIAIIEDSDLYQEVELRKNLLRDCISNDSMDSTRAIIRKDHNFPDSIDEDVSVFVWISFIEIYNENVYDLLEVPRNSKAINMAPPLRRNLKIVGNDGNVFVKDLTSVYVKSSIEALHLLKYGLQRVNYAATSINHNSSRSHCIFTIDIIKFNRESDCSHISYRFCDLAGSERLHKTGNVGSRLKEAQRINTSLLVLGRCLDAANSNCTRKKQPEIIPFRESKLTMLLQSALLGKEKLTMIVNIMPTDKYYEENINVLGFASIAKNIVFKQPSTKMQKSRCSFLSDHYKVSNAMEHENDAHLELLKENIFLRSEVGRLSDILDNLKTQHMIELNNLERNLRYELTEKHKELTEMKMKSAETRHKAELASLERQWQHKLDTAKNEYKWTIEDLREELEACKNSRKRRTADCLTAEFAKRQAVEVEIIDSDEELTDSSGNIPSTDQPEIELPVLASDNNEPEELSEVKSSISNNDTNDKSASINKQSLNAQTAEHKTDETKFQEIAESSINAKDGVVEKNELLNAETINIEKQASDDEKKDSDDEQK